MSSIKLKYNIPFICHALLDYEIKSNYGNHIENTINDFKEISLNSELSEFKKYCDTYLIYNNDDNYDIKKFYIINIEMENHAVSLIIDHINTRIILVNTGYHNNNHHKFGNNNYCCLKIYSNHCYNNLLLIIKEINFSPNLIIIDKKLLLNNINKLKENNKSILINKYDHLYLLLNILDYYIFNDKLSMYKHIYFLLEEKSNELKQKPNNLNILNFYLNEEYNNFLIPLIYDNDVINHLNNTFEYHNNIIYDYDVFKENNINQVAGSCTFHSIIMSFYYIYYVDMPTEYNEKFKLLVTNIKKMLINYLSTFKLNNLDKYVYNDKKYSNLLLLSLLKIINRKYENKLIQNIIDYKYDIKYSRLDLFIKKSINNKNLVLSIKINFGIY